MADAFMSPAEVAAAHPHLGGARTIQRWCRLQWVEHGVTPSGRIKFSPAQVELLLERRAAQTRHVEVHTPNPDFDPTSLRKVTAIGRAPSRRSA
jgi:hypothetical protein